VNLRKIRWTVALLAIAAVMTLGACRRDRAAAPPPPPPPPPPAPTASLTANPTAIQQGQSAELRWQTENSTDVTIEGIGPVQASGSQRVSPTESTTYRLMAKGPGGSQEATARITVTAAPPPPRPAAPTQTLEQMFQESVRDIFFDYDQFEIRPDARATLQRNADFLKQHEDVRIIIEGHADERGSTEYNLALGENRAMSTRDALAQLGVNVDRIRTISFGKEKPFCTEANEQCWQQNRRAHFVLQR
jgi:peptidoglycan-associated lipoprotein